MGRFSSRRCCICSAACCYCCCCLLLLLCVPAPKELLGRYSVHRARSFPRIQPPFPFHPASLKKKTTLNPSFADTFPRQSCRPINTIVRITTRFISTTTTTTQPPIAHPSHTNTLQQPVPLPHTTPPTHNASHTHPPNGHRAVSNPRQP